MAATLDLAKLTATAVAELTRSGKLTVEEYATTLLKQIGNDDPHAWSYLSSAQVLAQARTLDALPATQRGPLHGVAIGVKDIMLTKDMPTQYGSPLYVGSGGGVDAEVVGALRELGCLVLGKTHTTEFAVSTSGPPTDNPHNPQHTPGGSSSGSAAAVAAYHVPLALGTQTGGSVIRPASFCGVWGCKPSWNGLSRDGVKIHVLTLDTVGLFARSPEDISLVLALLGLDDAPTLVPSPSTTPGLTGQKFGLVKSPVWDKALPPLVEKWEVAKAALVAAGATVEDVTLPHEFNNLQGWHKTISLGEGRGSFVGELRMADRLVASGQPLGDGPGWTDGRPWLDPEVMQHYGPDAPSRQAQVAAIDGAASLRPVIDDICSKYTALITPSTTGPAPAFDERRWTGDAVFNKMWTLLHVPVVNVPAFMVGELPMGISVVTARFGEQRGLAVARDLARVLGVGEVGV